MLSKFAVILAIFLLGCQAQVQQNPLLDELSSLKSEMALRNLTVEDTRAILELSKDPVEKYYANSFAWLVMHGKSEHYNHPLTFLDWYVKTGQESFCAPHEIGHIHAYIEAGDMDFALETFAVARTKVGMWEAQQDKNREKFPQYYTGLDELKVKVRQAVALLDSGDFSHETLELLEEIDEKSIC